MRFTQILALLVTILGISNLVRIFLYMFGADWHDVGHRKRKITNDAISSKRYRPWISIIVPAYNEEPVILRNLESIYANDYSYKEVILINDGSSDRTVAKARYFKRKRKLKNLHIITQPNSGKATAINNGIARARGSLIMILDADSSLHPRAITEMVSYFKNPKVSIAAANIKIIEDGTLFNMIQKFEYLICYRMKRAQTFFNVEYIIGGIASTFRKSEAKAVGLFDTDTVTEDIDFTLKLIRRGNKLKRAIYAPSAIAYTESVMTFSQLIRQRFRWKYGRTQSFLKNRALFFSRRPEHDWKLSWVQLPYTLYAELVFLIEPAIIAFIVYIIVRYHDTATLLSAYLVMTVYLILNVIAEETETLKSKLKLVALAPIQYPFFFILTAVEYVASIKTLVRSRQLLRGTNESKWQHVTRSGKAVSAKHLAV